MYKFGKDAPNALGPIWNKPGGSAGSKREQKLNKQVKATKNVYYVRYEIIGKISL